MVIRYYFKRRLVAYVTGLLLLLNFSSCQAPRDNELKIKIRRIALPVEGVFFPLASFSEDDELVVTVNNGFQFFKVDGGGQSLMPTRFVPLPDESWAEHPFASIGSFFISWEGEKLLIGPDLEPVDFIGLEQDFQKIHTSRSFVTELDNIRLLVEQVALPKVAPAGGGILVRGEDFYVYDRLLDQVLYLSGTDLINVSSDLELALIPGMSAFHEDGYSLPSERRNLWLAGFTSTGKIVGVSSADGAVFLFDAHDLSFERLGSASLGREVWQPGFKDDVLIVASGIVSKSGYGFDGARIEQWHFARTGIVKKVGVVPGVLHNTLTPFAVALKDRNTGVLVGPRGEEVYVFVITEQGAHVR